MAKLFLNINRLQIDGGHCRDRTCGPHRVKVMLYRWAKCPILQKEMVERTIPITQPRSREFLGTFLSFSRGYQISKMAAVADETTENREALVPMK